MSSLCFPQIILEALKFDDQILKKFQNMSTPSEGYFWGTGEDFILYLEICNNDFGYLITFFSYKELSKHYHTLILPGCFWYRPGKARKFLLM